MPNLMLTFSPLRLAFVVLPLALTSAALRADVPAQPLLRPTASQLLETELITGFLTEYHYKKPTLDDALSRKTLTRYIESIDPGRSYFLQSDIDKLSAYETRLDDYLRASNPEPAFVIFRVFRQRLYERVEHAKRLLERDFDFTVDESYVFDRGDSPWVASREQLDEIWRKRIKNDVLSLRLAGQEGDKLTDTLRGRYERLGRQTDQYRTEDVYQLFINAFTQSIEPHTAYLLPRASEDFEIRMSLSLEGIGAVLQSENEHTVIREIVTGGPADTSDQLRVEDRITGVGQGEDGAIIDVVGWRLDDVVDQIRGPKGTTVRLQVLPKGAGIEAPAKVITMTRNEIKLEDQAAQKAVIEVPTSDGQVRIGVIEVPAFYLDYEAYARKVPDYRSTTRDVRRLLRELQQEKVEGIVVDLRGNGGGSLTEATQLTGLFIESGPIVQVKDTTERVEVLRDPDPDIAYSGPLAVLVDGLSASASEIFAGAIQDYHRGVVIGEPTFGKGTVQQMVDLNNGIDDESDATLGQITMTVAQFYRVSGASTQHRGVVPDIRFPTVIDNHEQGERALDNALPWDEIEAAAYSPRATHASEVNDVRERHVQRMQQNPAFKYLMQEIRASEMAQNERSVSLLESKRRNEMESMEQASDNRQTVYRKASGLPVRTNEKRDGGFDPSQVLLKEAAHILYDLINNPAVEMPESLRTAKEQRG